MFIGQEASEKKIYPEFYKVEICPKLEICKIFRQNGCHLWHVIHDFLAFFCEDHNSQEQTLGEKILCLIIRLFLDQY